MEKELTGLTNVDVREVDRTYKTLDKAERGIQLLTHELTKVCEFSFFFNFDQNLTQPPRKKERKRKLHNELEPVRKRKYERVNKRKVLLRCKKSKLHSEWRISFIDKLIELCNDNSHAAYIRWIVPSSIISFNPDKFQVSKSS